MTTWQDSFDGASPDLTWTSTPVGAIATSAGKGYCNSAADVASYVASASFADGYVQANKHFSSNNTISPAIRITDEGNLYQVTAITGTTTLRKRVAGAWTTLGTYAGFTVGDLLTIEAIGTTIKAYVNGVERISATDSAHANGFAGVWSTTSNASHSIDNWEASDLQNEAAPALQVRRGPMTGNWHR